MSALFFHGAASAFPHPCFLLHALFWKESLMLLPQEVNIYSNRLFEQGLLQGLLANDIAYACAQSRSIVHCKNWDLDLSDEGF